MTAACICGCYKNNANLPTPFQGNMAHAVERQKYVNKPSLPYYAQAYGNIISGEMMRNVFSFRPPKSDR